MDSQHAIARKPLLEVQCLVKEFVGARGSRVRALDDVSLQLDGGLTLGVVGESGSGKSTLARCIVGIVKPDSGRILLHGHDIIEFGRRERKMVTRRIQIVSQDPYSALNPALRIRDSMADGLRIHTAWADRKSIDEKVIQMLDVVGLEPAIAGRYSHELSGGQAQRVCIARALALDPDIVVLDEVTSSLDVSVQASILNTLTRLQRELGVSYLCISHDLRVVRHMSDSIAVLHEGRLVEYGGAEHVLSSPSHPYTQCLVEKLASGVESVR